MSNNLWVTDVEGNGLHPTKMWCLSTRKVGRTKTFSTSNYDEMRSILSDPSKIIIGHNFIRWDAVELERLLEFEIKAKIIDTLPISWYLRSKDKRHGLEEIGERLGYPKKPIPDWDSLPLEEYIERCEGDVEINSRLWDEQWEQLMEIYEGDEDEIWRFLDYLMFKMDCAKEQERSRWRLDVKRCEDGLKELIELKAEKVVQLSLSMPKVSKYKYKSKPAKPFKQCGGLSVTGKRWFDLLKEHGKSEHFAGEIRVFSHHEDPNPNSVQQMKDWLFSLGWAPRHLKYVRNKETGEVRTIPQVKSEFVDGEVCDSVKELFGKEPGLEALSGLTTLTHRISILKGYLDNVDEDGYIQAQIQGLTNTLRFKHKVVLNLPGIDKAYGDLVRGCLIAPEGYELCGADMCSLEDRTGMHYQYPLDPDYVEKKSGEGYDPHTTMAIAAGMMTEEEEEFYKWYKENH